MKFHRITATLPAGVVVTTESGVENYHDILSRYSTKIMRDALDDMVKSKQVQSNAPIKLSLEVPEGEECSVAQLLHDMAKELMDGKGR